MLVLLGLVCALFLGQILCARRSRRRVERLMRPGDTWDPEDLDAWLALIEPFPLGDESRKA